MPKKTTEIKNKKAFALRIGGAGTPGPPSGYAYASNAVDTKVSELHRLKLAYSQASIQGETKGAVAPLNFGKPLLNYRVKIVKGRSRDLEHIY